MTHLQKKISVQLKLTSNRGAIGRDCLMYVVRRLARFMYYRINRLVSRRTPKQMMTDTMSIKFRRKASNRERKPLCIKKRVAMDIDKELEPFLRFWHEATWPLFLLRIAVACSKVRRDILTRAKYIALEATEFIPCHIPKYESKYDTKSMIEFMSDMKEACGSDFDPYLPASEEQLKFLAGYPKTHKEKDSRLSNKLKQHKRKWKQTKIDDYFKPCRSKLDNCRKDNES